MSNSNILLYTKKKEPEEIRSLKSLKIWKENQLDELAANIIEPNGEPILRRKEKASSSETRARREWRQKYIF